jgi:FMN reductase
MSILLIGGSPSAESRSARLLDYVGTLLTQAGHSTARLILRDLPAEALLHGDLENSALREAKEQVGRSQAVVLATPVYKATYSGILKVFIDLLPQKGLAGKTVLPIATGGSFRHRLPIELSFRQLLLELSASEVLPILYAVESQVAWGPETGLRLDLEVERHLTAGVEQLSQSLNHFAKEAAGRR